MGKRESMWLTVLFAVYLYPVVGTKYVLFSYFYIYGIPLIYLLVNVKVVGGIFRHLKISYLINIFLYISLLCLSIVIPVVYNTNDYTYVWTVLGVLRQLIIYIFLCTILVKKYRHEICLHFMKYHIYSSCLYVVGSIIFFVFKPIKNIWINLWQFPNMSLLSSYGYTLRFGWSGFSNFRSTITCTISFVFILFLLFENRYVKKPNTRWYLCGIIVLAGNMFYGRSGFVASVVAFVVALVIYRKLNVKVLLPIAIIIGVFMIILFQLVSSNQQIKEWYDWVSSPIISYFKTGHFNNYSVDHLLNDMIFIPETKTLIWGDGRYANYYMDTDSGFMRQILFWGLPITCLCYIYTIQSMQGLFCKQDKKIALLLLLLLILFEIKGEVYYELVPMFLLLSYFIRYDKKG